LIQSLGPNTLVAFTDGSASPNPGPAGAGAYIFSTNSGENRDAEAIAALGQGSNNLGELWGLGMACQMALARITSQPPNTYTSYRIFTDSMYARQCVRGEWHSPKYKSLVESIQRLTTQLSGMIDFEIMWVPAHVGIDANEHADFLAGEGTKRSTAGKTNVDAAKDFGDYNFLPNPLLFPSRVPV